MNSMDKVMAVHQFINKIDEARDELAGVLGRDSLIEKLKSSREHTQKWYASHYGKLEDWARKVLPKPWRNQFFSCIANGTYDGILDVGKPYMSKVGMITPSGYIHMDDAKGQLVLDQTTRAEDAEIALAEMTKERDSWRSKFLDKDVAPDVY